MDIIAENITGRNRKVYKWKSPGLCEQGSFRTFYFYSEFLLRKIIVPNVWSGINQVWFDCKLSRSSSFIQAYAQLVMPLIIDLGSNRMKISQVLQTQRSPDTFAVLDSWKRSFFLIYLVFSDSASRSFFKGFCWLRLLAPCFCKPANRLCTWYRYGNSNSFGFSFPRP